MDNNPFAAGSGMWITQSVRTCPICRHQYTNADYTIEARYYDEVKTLNEVCPGCMKRLGFSEPKNIITTFSLNNLMRQLHNFEHQYGGEYGKEND